MSKEVDRQIKERGIIFHGEMVRAILEGRKTQTRSMLSPLQLKMIDTASSVGECYPLDSGQQHENSQSYYREWCPFGQVGDRLWVKETWATQSCFDDRKPKELSAMLSLHYGADGTINTGKIRPSSQMPHWASRITLEITDIRVERLQDISARDAISEGLIKEAYYWPLSEYPLDNVAYRTSVRSERRYSSPVQCFQNVWESMYGQDSWQSNPFVWVVEFKRVEAA